MVVGSNGEWFPKSSWIIWKYHRNPRRCILYFRSFLYKRTSYALKTHWINNEKNYQHYLKVRLFEIFTSVEGEGILFGTKTLFVRLAGCPFTCFYCDTKESLLILVQNIQLKKQQLIDSSLKIVTKVNFTGVILNPTRSSCLLQNISKQKNSYISWIIMFWYW